MPVMAGVAEALVDDGRVGLHVQHRGRCRRRAGCTSTRCSTSRWTGSSSPGERIDRRLPLDLSEVAMPVVYAFTDAPEGAVTLVSDDAQGARGGDAAGCRRSAAPGSSTSPDRRASPRPASAPRRSARRPGRRAGAAWRLVRGLGPRGGGAAVVGRRAASGRHLLRQRPDRPRRHRRAARAGTWTCRATFRSSASTTGRSSRRRRGRR